MGYRLLGRTSLAAVGAEAIVARLYQGVEALLIDRVRHDENRSSTPGERERYRRRGGVNMSVHLISSRNRANTACRLRRLRWSGREWFGREQKFVVACFFIVVFRDKRKKVLATNTTPIGRTGRKGPPGPAPEPEKTRMPCPSGDEFTVATYLYDASRGAVPKSPAFLVALAAVMMMMIGSVMNFGSRGFYLKRRLFLEQDQMRY